MVFDFGAELGKAEAFHPSADERLPKGSYWVKIIEFDKATSSGGYPMIKIKVECDQGVQWDNLVISSHEFSLAKIKGLCESAKVAPPSVENGEMDASTGEFSDGYAGKFLGRWTGIVVRDEEDNRPDHRGEGPGEDRGLRAAGGREGRESCFHDQPGRAGEREPQRGAAGVLDSTYLRLARFGGPLYLSEA